MKIPEILKELDTYTGKFPREALREAIEQREAITPELLRIVEAIAANPTESAQRDHSMLPVFALYLLAQFHEKRAFPAVVRMFNAPGDTSYELVGGTVTEGLHRILASVYDGNLVALHGLIENEEADEFVRDAAIRALLVLENSGQIARAQVVDYFRSLFHGKLERTHSFAWDGLACAVVDLPAPELLEEVRQAYTEDLVDECVVYLEQIERDLAAPKARHRHRDTLISDAIGEMEGWGCFHAEGSGPSEPPEVEVPMPPPEPSAPTEYVAPKPFTRDQPKIGRNEPCPCGSGKKYKKCCGK